MEEMRCSPIFRAGEQANGQAVLHMGFLLLITLPCVLSYTISTLSYLISALSYMIIESRVSTVITYIEIHLNPYLTFHNRCKQYSDDQLTTEVPSLITVLQVQQQPI
jgi:hypothetical protein